MPVAAQGSPSYSETSNGLPTQSLWTSDLTFFDLNGDGQKEAMYLGPRKGHGEDYFLTVMEWQTNQWVNISAEVGTSSMIHTSYGGLDVADLNHDGDWDIFAGSHGGYSVDAYLFDSGTSWTESTIRSGTSDTDAWSVKPGDFNSDGHMDILVGGFWGQDAIPFAGDGKGGWTEMSNGLPRGWQKVEAHFTDVNRDGHLDIVAAFGRGDWVYSGDGRGNWANASEGLPDESLSRGAGVDWGDFNDDGFVDLVMSTPNRIYAFQGDGTGSWVDRSAGLPNRHYESMVLSDLNNDDFDDIVGLTDGGLVEMYLATGAGGWVKSQNTYQGNAEGHRINVADWDSNGYRDIIAGFGTDEGNYPGSVRVWSEATTPTELEAHMAFPDGNEVFRGGSAQLITWLTADPTGSTARTVDLDLSIDGDDGPWTRIVKDAPDSGFYQWQVPQVYSDDCYIRITVDDHQSNTYQDLTDEAFGINPPGIVNRPPTLDILKPNGGEGEQDLEFKLRWSASDPDPGDELTLDLYFDNNTNASDGLELIVENLTNSGSFDWDLSALLNGTIFPYFVLDDNNGSVVSAYAPSLDIFHPPPNVAPLLAILTPNLPDRTAHLEYEIEWLATDANLDDITLTLFYDEDTDPDNGRNLIAMGLSNSGSYDWDTEHIPDGEYHICGLASDWELSRYACSAFALTIYHPPPPPNEPPELEVEVPSFGMEVDEGMLVRWTATDPQNDQVQVDLSYLPPSSSTPVPLAQGLRGSNWFWDTISLPDGSYRLIASATDGEFTVFDNTTFTISHPNTADVAMEEGVYLVSPNSPREGDEVTLTVFVNNIGYSQAETTVTFTLEEGPPTILLPVDLTIPGEDSKLATLTWTVEAGTYQILVKASSAGPVDNMADNEQVIVIEVARKGGTGGSNGDDTDWAFILGVMGVASAALLAGAFIFYRMREPPMEAEELPATGYLMPPVAEAYPQVEPPSVEAPPEDDVEW